MLVGALLMHKGIDAAQLRLELVFTVFLRAAFILGLSLAFALGFCFRYRWQLDRGLPAATLIVRADVDGPDVKIMQVWILLAVLLVRHL